MLNIKSVIIFFCAVMLSACYPQFSEAIPSEALEVDIEGIWCQNIEDCYTIIHKGAGDYRAIHREDQDSHIVFSVKKIRDAYFLELVEEAGSGLVYSVFWLENGNFKDKMSVRRLSRDIEVVCSEDYAFENKKSEVVLRHDQSWSNCKAPIALFLRATEDMPADQLYHAKPMVYKRN